MTGKAVAKAHAKSSAAAAKGKSKKEDDDAYVAKGKAAKSGISDENKVKRPTSAYFYYCNERRETMKKEEPSLSMTD